MGKLGADERTGYKELSVVEGYDRWAATYDRAPNPLVMLLIRAQVTKRYSILARGRSHG